MKLYLPTLLILLLLGTQSCTEKPQNTINGYEYISHVATGDKKPSTGDYVYFRLTITDEKDSIISTMMDPGQLPLVKIPEKDIPGRKPNPVEELLRVSSEGDSVTLIMPIDSFNNTAMDLSQYEAIKYKIGVDKVLNEEEYQAESQKLQELQRAKIEETKKLLPEVTQKVEDFLAAYNESGADVQRTASGLEYKIIKEGSGKEINSGAMVGTHYYGALMDGQPFDNSYRKGDVFRLTVGRGEVIKGWDEGLQLLNEGGEAFFVIPSDLAYGASGSGSIPAGATIMFYVHIKEVMN